MLIFVSLGSCLGDSSRDTQKRTNSKLQRFVDRDHEMGYKMLRTLSVISNMFADVHELENKYGIRLTKRDPVGTFTVERILFLTNSGLASPFRRENSSRSKTCRPDPEQDGEPSATHEYPKEMSLFTGRDRQVRHLHRAPERIYCNAAQHMFRTSSHSRIQ